MYINVLQQYKRTTTKQKSIKKQTQRNLHVTINKPIVFLCCIHSFLKRFHSQLFVYNLGGDKKINDRSIASDTVRSAIYRE